MKADIIGGLTLLAGVSTLIWVWASIILTLMPT